MAKIIFLFVFTTAQIFPIDQSILEKVKWPLEFYTPITGSFTEYRNSTVHLGLDFKTYGINGFKVLSVSNGYIDSISYTKEGYGLSMITYSPELKLKTRYAHLNDFTGSLNSLELLRKSLLLLSPEEGFSIKLPKDDFRFKQSDWIARTGETGSGVAHLHLELFDSNGFYNPMNFKNYSQIDSKFPVIETIYIEPENGESIVLKAQKKTERQYEVETESQIFVSGKLKIKVAAFDLISSRNRNGIFGFSLSVKEQKLFEKVLDFLPFKELAYKHALYDINKSSLNPPKYVYNLFDGKDEKNYSLDTSFYLDGTNLNLKVAVKDTNQNESAVDIPITIKRKIAIPKTNERKKRFSTKDSRIMIDFHNNKIFGSGEITIEKIDSIPENSKSEDLTQIGDAYEIKSTDFSWLGKAKASFQKIQLTPDLGLYLYDKDTKIWNLLKTKSQKDSVSFELQRTGILSVMKDISPPKISYPYLINRNFNPPDSIGENFIERFYSVSDKGSGIGKMNVLFEGQSYPFEFDVDRYFIKIQIPKSLKKYKSTYIVQIQIADRAGNRSDWFTDLVKLK